MSRADDCTHLSQIPKEKIPEFIFLHLRNLWAVDGLYYLGIEEAFGIKAATEIDRKVWEIMGKIEARKLKVFLDIKNDDIASMMNALLFSSWAMDLEDKQIIIKKDSAILRNVRCRVQNTRIAKGLPEFGCKPVRWGFLKAFAHEFNPNIVVNCTICPPDKHPNDLWCEWEFSYKEK